MCREIKFRAWHFPTQRMFNVFSWCKDCVFEDSLDGVGTSPTLPAESKDCKLMQFTGLKDKNGKEIYFGDVLATSNDNPEFDIWTKKDNGFTVVIENKDELGINYSDWQAEKTENKSSIFEFCFIEVIGNIYENPELLNQ